MRWVIHKCIHKFLFLIIEINKIHHFEYNNTTDSTYSTKRTHH